MKEHVCIWKIFKAPPGRWPARRLLVLIGLNMCGRYLAVQNAFPSSYEMQLSANETTKRTIRSPTVELCWAWPQWDKGIGSGMLECLLFVLRRVALLIKTTHAVKRISRFARTAHPVYSFASAKVSKHLSTSLQRRNVTLVRQWFQMFSGHTLDRVLECRLDGRWYGTWGWGDRGHHVAPCFSTGSWPESSSSCEVWKLSLTDWCPEGLEYRQRHHRSASCILDCGKRILSAVDCNDMPRHSRLQLDPLVSRMRSWFQYADCRIEYYWH